jgi:hypothetical protein
MVEKNPLPIGITRNDRTVSHAMTSRRSKYRNVIASEDRTTIFVMASVSGVERGDGEDGVSMPGRRPRVSPTAEAVANATHPQPNLSPTPLTLIGDVDGVGDRPRRLSTAQPTGVADRRGRQAWPTGVAGGRAAGKRRY